MKTIIETDTYPVKIVLVPETDEDRKVMKVLKAEFYRAEDSKVVVDYEDPDHVLDYGKGVLVFSSFCTLN